MEAKYRPRILLVGRTEILLFKRVTQYRKEKSIQADGSFNYIGHVILINLRIEILDFFARILLVLTEVKVGTRVDTFYFFEPKWKFVFDINCCIGIMSELHVIVEVVFF